MDAEPVGGFEQRRDLREQSVGIGQNCENRLGVLGAPSRQEKNRFFDGGNSGVRPKYAAIRL